MYFMMRSLEKLAGMYFGSRIFVLIIALVGMEMFTRTMVFENKHFWVSGPSHVRWTAAWMLLFIYWNVCIFYARHRASSPRNKKLYLLYGLCALDLSYMLSVLYWFVSRFFQVQTPDACPFDIVCTFNVLADSPSIWCTFASMQVVLILFLFRKMNAEFIPEERLASPLTVKTRLALLGATVVCWIVCFLHVPVFFGVGWKMITH
jgi:hypothetical protein